MNKREWMLRYALTESRSVENVSYIQLFVEKASNLYDAIVVASPQEPAWIEHRGAKPYPEGMVDVELRDGTKCVGVDSDDLVWTHDLEHPRADIIAWRPA